MNIFFYAAPLVFLVAGCSASSDAEGDGLQAQATTFDRVDYEHPLFLQARPGAECVFSTVKGAAQKDSVRADGTDGRVRFYAPPSAWGPALDVVCTLGSDTQRFSVNMNDTSTYQLDTDIFKKRSDATKRPALTGDLLALSTEEISSGGYPPRPDVAANPVAYQRWVSIVSEPRAIENITFVAALGRYGSHWYNTINTTEGSPPGVPAWTGRIYDTNGWTGFSTPSVNQGGTYTEYALELTVPRNANDCPVGKTCSTFIWGGLGGWSDPAGARAGLIQSGIVIQNLSAPVIAIEYFPNSWLAGVGTISISPLDDLQVWGFAYSNSSCRGGAQSSAGDYACFNFFNRTTQTYLETDRSALSLNRPLRSPTVIFSGATFESIAEKDDPNSLLTDFNGVNILDFGFDYHGTYHDVASDPWIFVEGNSALGNRVSHAYYPGFSDQNDRNPFFIQWIRGQ